MKTRSKSLRILTAVPMAMAILLLFLLVCWGCSQDGAGSNATPNTDEGKHTNSGTYSGEAMIGSSTGGAISVDLADGTSVMIDIPGRALAYSKEINLSVIEEEAGDGYSPPSLAITVDPALALLEPVQLSVTYPENTDVSGMVLFAGGRDMIPLKQSMEDGKITGWLYRLGSFSISKPDENTMARTADLLAQSGGNGDWQEAYTTFNALVWLTDYFSSTGNSPDSANCFYHIGEKSLQSAQAFLASISQVEKGSPEYNALVKFRALMVLCENPDDILDDMDRIISSIDT